MTSEPEVFLQASYAPNREDFGVSTFDIVHASRLLFEICNHFKDVVSVFFLMFIRNVFFWWKCFTFYSSTNPAIARPLKYIIAAKCASVH